MKNNKEDNTYKIIFIISLLYYVVWIGLAIYYYFAGINSGWAIASSGDKMWYGPKAFMSGIIMGVIFTLYRAWFIPLYQIIYLIVKIVKKFKKNK